jgi:hypothetical protein
MSTTSCSKRSGYYTIATTLTFSVVTTMMTTTFAVFPCDTLDDRSNLLMADYSIDCNADLRVLWVVYGWGTLIIFSLGLR